MKTITNSNDVNELTTNSVKDTVMSQALVRALQILNGPRVIRPIKYQFSKEYKQAPLNEKTWMIRMMLEDMADNFDAYYDLEKND